MRQIYPFLLAAVSSLVTAVLLRPSLVEEFATHCDSWMKADTAQAFAAEFQDEPGEKASRWSGLTRYMPWTADEEAQNAGEVFLSDDSGSTAAPRAANPYPATNPTAYAQTARTDATVPPNYARPTQPVYQSTPPPYQPTTPSYPATTPAVAAVPNAYQRPSQPARGTYDQAPPSQYTAVARRAPVGLQQDSRAMFPGDILLCEGAKTLARVGDEFILGNEILPAVNETWSQIPPEKLKGMPESIQQQQRDLLTKQLLEDRIRMKVIFLDAKRSIPPEGLDHFEKQIAKQYRETELPKKLETLDIDSVQEYKEVLAKVGTSLERQERSYIEQTLTQYWMSQQVSPGGEIPHDEIVQYYRDHQKDFETPARARWEQLTITKSRHPIEQEAKRLIAEMGNEVMSGTPLSEVAKRSEGGGGPQDWTSKGSLVSDELDAALFGLPIGSLSTIIEDDRGFHIIRVVEREELSRTSFIEAQVEIREKIRQEQGQRQMQEYRERLRREIPVWTIFDEKTPEDGDLATRR